MWFGPAGSESSAFVSVARGERRYLIEASAIARFCAPDSGKPWSACEGSFYLRDGYPSLPAEGDPTGLDGTPACR